MTTVKTISGIAKINNDPMDVMRGDYIEVLEKTPCIWEDYYWGDGEV